MRIFTVSVLFVFFTLTTLAQHWQRASLNDDGSIWVEQIPTPEDFRESKTEISQISGFPVRYKANPNFKNMRNVALQDMNNDSVDDVIFVADNKLVVYTFQGLLWERTLNGSCTYPPSVGDVNGDGFMDIVQITTGLNGAGWVYVYDRNGVLLPGWPINLNNNWLLCAPVLSDLNNNGDLEIIVNERVSPLGHINIFNYDATPFNSNWPVTIDGTPAVTPSVADVDGDGEKDIVVYSTKSKYIFSLDGQPKSGFPQTTAPQQSYSYQSPVIADLDNDGTMEIVGSTHGDLPQFYSMNHDGTSFGSWPHNVPGGNWTYSPPTVVKINNDWKIFMSRPIGQTPEDMFYGWDANGNLLSGFPITKVGGLEGFTAVADITNDNDYELIFGSNLLDSNDLGFIHAYKMDGSSEINGFPLKPKGFTFMNGVCVGDINGNGKTELVALSYSSNFGTQEDSIYINVYEIDVPFNRSDVLWGTYKGNNRRTGFVDDALNEMSDISASLINLNIFPNPVNGHSFSVEWEGGDNNSKILIVDILGRNILESNMEYYDINKKSVTIPCDKLEKGVYNLILINNGYVFGSKNFVVM
ncbi:MAG: FG-GAP-like repeat-containing protein [Bacteroidales bacterium]|nr:FG-GAP-like repeat-containing protein [Bacteroidales bacterium]